MLSADTSSELLLPLDPPTVEPHSPARDDHRQLEGTAMRATVWTVVSYGLTQAIRLGNNVILTRLLLPQYFGLMALLTTLVVGMTLLSDVGLLPSVIGSPRGDEPLFLNTAWTVQILRGATLWILSLLLAVPLAALYGDPRIRLLLPVLAFSMVIAGFASTNLLRAARHISVRRLLLIDLGSQLVGIVVMLLAAWVRPSVWALVLGTLAAASAKSILSHIPAVLPGERNRLAWDRTSVQSLVRFGRWIMLGTAFYFFASQADRLILGKLVTFTTLGIYNIAFTIADIPRQVILQFSNRVGFPFVSKMVHLPFPTFRSNVLRYRFYALSAGALILTTVILLGGPFIQKLYDVRYADATWMVPLLALGLWHTLLYTTAGDILFALGKPIYNAIGTACFCVTMFLSLPLAFHFFGLRGGVISVAAGDLPLYLVLSIGAFREKVNLWRQDALATLVFLTLLTLGYTLRHFL